MGHFFLAYLAGAVQFQLMALYFKKVLFRHLLLKMFNIHIFKFDNFSAMETDKVVVMMVVIDEFVTGLPLSKLPALGESGLAKKMERPVNRRQSDRGVLLRTCLIQLFGGDMSRHGQENFKDDLALAGEF